MADWKVNDPLVITKRVDKGRSDRLELIVRIRFLPDPAGPDPVEKEYRARGAGAWETIKSRSFNDQDTLNEQDLIPDVGTSFSPTRPSAKDQNIADTIEAVRRLVALERYMALTGKAGVDNVAGSTLSYNNRRNSFIATIDVLVTAGGQINNRLLDPLPDDIPAKTQDPV